MPDNAINDYLEHAIAGPAFLGAKRSSSDELQPKPKRGDGKKKSLKMYKMFSCKEIFTHRWGTLIDIKKKFWAQNNAF